MLKKKENTQQKDWELIFQKINQIDRKYRKVSDDKKNQEQKQKIKYISKIDNPQD